MRMYNVIMLMFWGEIYHLKNGMFLGSQVHWLILIRLLLRHPKGHSESDVKVALTEENTVPSIQCFKDVLITYSCNKGDTKYRLI